MKVLDYIIIAFVVIWFAVAVFIIAKNWRRKKRGCCGNSGCSGNCGACTINCEHKKRK